LTAGTTVSVVSGEDYAPVPGATLILAGREYVADGAGELMLSEDLPFGSFVDVVAHGFLNRQTLVRSDGGTRFVLWPRETASGMSGEFTAQIVYTYGWKDEPEHGSSPLERSQEGVHRVLVWVSEEIRQDARAGRRHELAVEEINAHLEGRVVYVLTPTRPSSGVFFEAKVNPGGDETCAEGARAYFRAFHDRRGEITGGEIVYCGLDVARDSTVAHELGHSVGLQHSYGWEELMSPYFSHYRVSTFSAREALAMRLLFERPAGNRFPDTDREVTAFSAAVRTTICY
jgi:hypothetical protein